MTEVQFISTAAFESKFVDREPALPFYAVPREIINKYNVESASGA